MKPVRGEDSGVPFHASLYSDGRLWIPEELRKQISLSASKV